MKKCRECQKPMADNMFQCTNPKCRAWNISSDVNVEEMTVILSKAKAKGKAPRIPISLCSKVYKDGIPRTSLNLLGGWPGAGKTTLCLQIADEIAGYDEKRELIYIANEQSAEELNETGERLELKNWDRIRVIRAMGGVPNDLRALILKFNPSCFFLDSITKWVGNDFALAVLVAKVMKEICVELNSPAFIINQVTKDGDHAGSEQLQHAVDSTGILDVEGEPSPEAVRTFVTSKARFAPAPEFQHYRMGPKGLYSVVLNMNDDEDEEDEEEK